MFCYVQLHENIFGIGIIKWVYDKKGIAFELVICLTEKSPQGGVCRINVTI